MNPARFLELAGRLAEYSNVRHHKLGAILARGNRIIGVGFNVNKSHPRSRSRSIHAELKALINSRSGPRGSTIYVARFKFDGTMGLARPCGYCRELLLEEGVTDVWYTSEQGIRYEEII